MSRCKCGGELVRIDWTRSGGCLWMRQKEGAAYIRRVDPGDDIDLGSICIKCWRSTAEQKYGRSPFDMCDAKLVRIAYDNRHIFSSNAVSRALHMERKARRNEERLKETEHARWSQQILGAIVIAEMLWKAGAYPEESMAKEV